MYGAEGSYTRDDNPEKSGNRHPLTGAGNVFGINPTCAASFSICAVLILKVEVKLTVVTKLILAGNAHTGTTGLEGLRETFRWKSPYTISTSRRHNCISRVLNSADAKNKNEFGGPPQLAFSALDTMPDD